MNLKTLTAYKYFRNSLRDLPLKYIEYAKELRIRIPISEDLRIECKVTDDIYNRYVITTVPDQKISLPRGNGVCHSIESALEDVKYLYKLLKKPDEEEKNDVLSEDVKIDEEDVKIEEDEGEGVGVDISERKDNMPILLPISLRALMNFDDESDSSFTEVSPPALDSSYVMLQSKAEGVEGSDDLSIRANDSASPRIDPLSDSFYVPEIE